ncbi:GNAT family N-acetyltransferase [Facilibium subflavum]|uniref:GNAT family N-acetyltransferase n=1 Tax=Facilibium subflavum TaxID=2219058 RepID=UPI000E64FA89|nr:GNAT family N-acetyltransferase [Facilibium subflavum]
MNTIITLLHSRDIIPDKNVDLVLLKAQKEDVDILSQMHAEAFSQSLVEIKTTKASLLDSLQRPNMVLWKFFDKKTQNIIGMASSTFDGHLIHLADVVINKKHRNQGFGQLLMSNLIDQTRLIYNRPKVYLQLRITNQVALHVYLKLGFEFVDMHHLSNQEKWLKAS